MAKRIMLSVVPAVQSEGERHHTGGFDYKALKSAVNGAKDLIRFGTKACVDELEHIKTDADSSAGQASESAREYLLNQRYIRCLNICDKLFATSGLWGPYYGGDPWRKIAKILLQLSEEQLALTHLRAQSTTNPDPKTDYLAAEVSLMKQMVITMNVFDGLAHNTSDVMENLAEIELDAMGITTDNIVNKSYDDPAFKDLDSDARAKLLSQRQKEAQERRSDYLHKMRRLMDAKELDDPFLVYNEVKHIIEQSENKHLFGDYIKRIRENPESKVKQTQKELDAKIELIRSRKLLKEGMNEIYRSMDALVAVKDKILQIKKLIGNVNDISRLTQEARVKLTDMGGNAMNMRNVLTSRFADFDDNNKLIWRSSVVSNVFDVLGGEFRRALYTTQDGLIKLHTDFRNQYSLDEVSNVVNDVNNLKRIVWKIGSMIDTI